MKAANSGIVLLQHILWPEAIPVLQVQAWRIAQREHTALQRGCINLTAVIHNKVQALQAPPHPQNGIPLLRIKVADSQADNFATNIGMKHLWQP